MSDNARITDLLKIMHRLIEIMEREIAMLRAMKPTEMQDLQRDKIVLAAAYEAQITALREDKSILQSLEPRLRGDLEDAAEVFQKTLVRNEQALKAAKETTDRVLQAIVREVEKQRSEQSSYSASGASDSGGNADHPISVAVDQRL